MKQVRFLYTNKSIDFFDPIDYNFIKKSSIQGEQAMDIFKRSNKCVLGTVDTFGRDIIVGDTEIPTPKENRLVGLFYFLWLGEHGRQGPYDISKIVEQDPEAGYKTDSSLWGGIGVYHHWGEPLYGYYCSDDEWVIRKHMKLFIQADIDFLFFDTTNAVIYENNVKTIMRVLKEYYDEGWNIPKVMFYTNSSSGATVESIYKNIYLKNYCQETWFCLEGKPVIIAKEEECSHEAREFFNIKMSQWPNEADMAGGWPWMDFARPQRVFPNLKGEPEVINVSVAQHPQLRFGDSVLYGEEGNCGRAFHKDKNDPEPDAWKKGYNFAEQFEHAIKEDPPIVLVTGWNEWLAGRWNGIPSRPIMFVDCANYEYSRDIEMMKGGYFDNYYMQLVSYVKRYKGSKIAPSFSAAPTDIPLTEETFGKDSAVYYGFSDGGYERCAKGYGELIYENRSQRNVIDKVAVRHDNEYISFSILTKDPIKGGFGEGSFMNIYINTEGGSGYSFVIKNASLFRTSKREDIIPVKEVAKLDCDTADKLLRVKVKRSLLGLTSGSFSLRFKVADSKEEYRTMEDLYINGDSAPLGRLDFLYKAE